MKSSTDVVVAGFNAVRQDGVLARIIGGKGTHLYCRTENNVTFAVDVSEVQEFIKL